MGGNGRPDHPSGEPADGEDPGGPGRGPPESLRRAGQEREPVLRAVRQDHVREAPSLQIGAEESERQAVAE